MNVLVVGSGGREHALSWNLSQSPYAEKVFAAPGNAGTPNTVNIQPTDFSALADFAEKENFLTVVGPEAPLAQGIVDYFSERKLRILGPSAKAAEIESSKIFAKEFMDRHDIPSPGYKVFDSLAEAIGHARRNGWKTVVKTDGLAAGKGVFVCETEKAVKEALQTIMVRKEFGDANGKRVILEDKVAGTEASFIALTDGEKVIPLAHAKDYKRLEDNDVGPNTGGMGSYSPNSRINASL
jgi:phosphoribosylamine--glycine ligase